MLFNKRLLTPLLMLLYAPNCVASSYQEQLIQLERTPTSTLHMAQQLPDSETRGLLYHSISNGGLLVDVYKSCSKKYNQYALYYLTPEEMPKLYAAVQKAIPAALRANTEFYFFLSDTPINTYGWSYRYAPLYEGSEATHTIALPLARDAFLQLDDAAFEEMVTAKTAQCLLYHHQSLAAREGRTQRDQKSVFAGTGIGIATFLVTLYALHLKGWLIPLIESTKATGDSRVQTILMCMPAVALGSYVHLYTHRWQTEKLKRLLTKLFRKNFETLQHQTPLDKLLTGYRTALLLRSLQGKHERQNTLKYLQKARDYHTAHGNDTPPKLHKAYEDITVDTEEDERLTRKYHTLSGDDLTQHLEEELTQTDLQNLDREHRSQAKEDRSWLTGMLRGY